MDVIINMGTVLNPKVTDLFTFMIWIVIPFNLLKGAIMTVVILPLYKKMEKILGIKQIINKKTCPLTRAGLLVFDTLNYNKYSRIY